FIFSLIVIVYHDSFPTQRSPGLLLFCALRRPRTSTLFPYTTLFRSLLGSAPPQLPAEEQLARLRGWQDAATGLVAPIDAQGAQQDRKSTRLNSSHVKISYAVFCLKKKKEEHTT